MILKGRFGGGVEEVFLTITSASLVQMECLIAQKDSHIEGNLLIAQCTIYTFVA